MKLIRTLKSASSSGGFAFLMNKQEVDWLLALLKIYPQMDSSCHKLTTTSAAEIKAEQETLEESMAQYRRDHRRKLDKFLASPGRFRLEAPDQYRFALTPEQMEWMLQLLNDVRVGCWVKLGRPELEGVPKRHLTGQAARDMTALELSGYFQMVLLEAFKGPAAAS
jgi:hypothetical protein